jgi:hypothetical protein
MPPGAEKSFGTGRKMELRTLPPVNTITMRSNCEAVMFGSQNQRQYCHKLTSAVEYCNSSSSVTQKLAGRDSYLNRNEELDQQLTPQAAHLAPHTSHHKARTTHHTLHTAHHSITHPAMTCVSASLAKMP